MSDAPAEAARYGHLPSVLSTWIFLLAEAGVPPADEVLAERCRLLAAALREDADPDPHGIALVEAVQSRLGGAEDPEAIRRFLVLQYGADRVDADMGADREARTRAAARYAFEWHRPWLAAIADRAADGSLGPHWVLVDGFDAERVHCLDPYPWDDRDESLVLPTVEFHVRWELVGAPSFRIR